MKTYRSRISILILALLLMSTGLLAFSLFFNERPYTPRNLVLNVAITLVYLFIIMGAFWIRYTVFEYDKVLVISAFFGLSRQRIDITQIRRISKSRSLLSSPAASLKRLRIEYGKYDDVLISPRGQEEFLEDLKKINPNIEFNL